MEKNGITWWYYLAKDHAKPSLFDNEHVDANTFIVRHENEFNRFAAFKSSAHFFMRYKETKQEHKTFYEIIYKEQKPYFDIDIDDVTIDGDQLIKDLHDVLKNLIQKTFLFLVYTSHTKSKKSYHVVLGNLYLSDCEEMKNLLFEVLENLVNPNKKYIDKNVYKSSQHLRLLGSHKYNKMNVKVLNEELTKNYFLPVGRRSLEAKAIYDFKLSLVSDITGCDYLQGYQTKKSYNLYSNNLDTKVVSKHNIETEYGDIIKQVNKLIYLNFDNVDFSIEQIKDNGNILIILRSNSPYYCNLCKTIHENENPYIYISVNNEVFFNCRRYDENGKNKKNGNVLLGKLTSLSCRDLIL